MATIADMMVRIGADIRDLDRKLGAASTGVTKFGRDLDRVGSTMTRNLTVPVVAGMAASVVAAQRVNKELRAVNTLTGQTGKAAEKSFRKMKREVAALSDELGVAQTELSRGLYDALGAGVPKENAIDFLRVSTKAAIAGVTDTQVAVDGITTSINAFGLEVADAQRVSDVLFQTVNYGKATFEELASQMYDVAPTARVAGVSIEQVGGALAAMTAAGTPARVATTQIRQALVSMMKPTAQLKEAYKDLGVSGWDELLKKSGSMQAAFEVLRKETGGNKEELFKMLGSIEAVQGFLALTGDNAGVAADMLQKVSNSTGATQRAFEEIDKARGLDRMKVDLENMAVVVGDKLQPAVSAVAEDVTALTKAFAGLDPSVQQAIIETALFLAVMGPLLKIAGTGFRILGGLGRAIGDVGKVARGAGAEAGGFGKFLVGVGRAAKVAVAPFRYIGAQLANLALGFRSAGTVASTMNGPMVRLGATLGRFLLPALSAIGTAIAAVAAAVGVSVGVIVAIIAAVVAAAVLLVVKWDWVKAKVGAAWAWLQAQAGKVWGAITSAVSSGMSRVSAAVSAGVGKVTGLFAKLRELTVKDVAFAFGYVVGYIVGSMVKVAIAIGKGVVNAVQAFGSALKRLPGIAVSVGSAVVEAIVGWATNIASTVARAATSAYSSFRSGLSKLPGVAVSFGKAAANGLYGFIRAIPGKVTSFLSKVPGAVRSVASEAAAAAQEVGAAIVQGMVSGVKAAAGALKDAAVGAVKGALKGAKDALDIRSPSRVTNREVGQPFAEGIAAGIMAKSKTVTKAAWEALLPAVDFAGEAAAVRMRAKGVAIVEAARSSIADAQRVLGSKGSTKAEKLAASRTIAAQKKRIVAGQRLVARANKKYLADDAVSAMTGRFAARADLARSASALKFSQSGRSAADTRAKLTSDIQAAQGQYGALQAYLQKNAKKLTAASRSAIQSQMAGLLDEIADAQAAITATFEQARQEWLDTIGRNRANRDAWTDLAYANIGATGSVGHLQAQIGSMRTELADLGYFWNMNWSTMSVDMQNTVIARMAELTNSIRDTEQAITDLYQAQARAAVDAIVAVNDLTLAQLDLQDALAGGATAETTAARTAALQDEYNRLAAYLQSGDAGLTQALRVQITQTMAQLATEIRQANQSIADAASTTAGSITSWWTSDLAHGASMSANATPVGGGGNNVTLNLTVPAGTSQGDADAVAAAIVTALQQQGVNL